MDLVDGTLKTRGWAKAVEKLGVLKQKSGRLIAAVERKVENGVSLKEKPAAVPAVYTIPLPPTSVPKSTVFDV
ncbi:hypothetical protein M3Y99_01325000 [Aphelenchoides fujianensis]|nr:hypothetical protein M3Y99_01325000 [Aphelenchoides fujianensis]